MPPTNAQYRDDRIGERTHIAPSAPHYNGSPREWSIWTVFKCLRLTFLMIFGCLTLLFLLGVAFFKAVQADHLRQTYKDKVLTTSSSMLMDDGNVAGISKFVLMKTHGFYL